MEITTTMVRFRCPKRMMEVNTQKAQMFAFGVEEDKKVWVPSNKLIVTPDNESNDLNVCTMPKWVYYKTVLPQYTQIDDEFVHIETITNL